MKAGNKRVDNWWLTLHVMLVEDIILSTTSTFDEEYTICDCGCAKATVV